MQVMVGRGSENKVPFVAAVELSEEGHPLVAHFDRVGSFSKLEIDRWAKCYLSESTQVVSDSLVKSELLHINHGKHFTFT